MIRCVLVAASLLMLTACQEQADAPTPTATTANQPKTLDDFHDSDWRGLAESFTKRVRALADVGERKTRYELAKKHGTHGDVCLASMGIATAYEDTGDETAWRLAEKQARMDCLPDSRTWEKRSPPEFAKFDDSDIERDPELSKQAALYHQYITVALESGRRSRIHDAVFWTESYQHDLNGGTFDERCEVAFQAAAQFAEALDEANYAKWKAIQKADCAQAGDTTATRAVASGAY